MKVKYVVIALCIMVLVIGAGAIFMYSDCDKHPYLCYRLDRFGVFYGDKLRASLFAGFLTLGGFLMSLKTFIVVNMKKEVFDTPQYREKFEANKDGVEQLYDPLKELTNVLFSTIALCITTAVMQLTLGVIDYFPAAVFCLAAAASSVMLLSWCLCLIRKNLLYLFDHIGT